MSDETVPTNYHTTEVLSFVIQRLRDAAATLAQHPPLIRAAIEGEIEELRTLRDAHAKDAPLVAWTEGDQAALDEANDGQPFDRPSSRALVEWLTSQYETYIDEAAELDQGSARWAARCAKAEALLSVLGWIERNRAAEQEP
jgi:hypothetical protein